MHFDHTASIKHLKSVIVGTVEPLIWQWWIQERGPAPSPLILDQNEARMAEKFFWEIAPLRHLSQGLDSELFSTPLFKGHLHSDN